MYNITDLLLLEKYDMKTFIEPLILYWVLFLRVSTGSVLPDGPVEFSATAEVARIVLYSVPSLLLVWYLMLKAKGLQEWGITAIKRKDGISAGLAFPALFLIGLTISLISPHVSEIPAAPRFLPPETALSWGILALSCTVSAYLEESYFRVYLLSKREEMGLGTYRAVLVSALMFAVCHAYEGPWGFLNSALSGTLLAFIYLRFRSLHGIAVAHALYNMVAYALNALPATPA